MYGDKTVSVVLPAYNEEQYIRAAVEDFAATGVVDEIIVVDNNFAGPYGRRSARDDRSRRSGNLTGLWIRVEAGTARSDG